MLYSKAKARAEEFTVVFGVRLWSRLTFLLLIVVIFWQESPWLNPDVAQSRHSAVGMVVAARATAIVPVWASASEFRLKLHLACLTSPTCPLTTIHTTVV